MLAVQVVKPEYVEPGLTSTLILIGAHVTEIAAVGICAAAGVATDNIENMYKAKRKDARLNIDTVSPIIHATQAPLITIVCKWEEKTVCIGLFENVESGGPEGT